MRGRSHHNGNYKYHRGPDQSRFGNHGPFGTNTYTGATLISAGILNIQNPQGLGTTAGGATVSKRREAGTGRGIAVGVET
ncbi:MAG: hypothetical protein IPG32_10290 [Saprospirales bacterium]|nr:hypothetical protein [Saprospirales bacterium]